jgi:SRSO17 transposase
VDDTGFAKKGTHSVGVARQYCGLLRKIDNCQVAVSFPLASERGSLPIIVSRKCCVICASTLRPEFIDVPFE